MNSASLLYQTLRFPVGVFVPLVVYHFQVVTRPSGMDAGFMQVMKSELLNAVNTRMTSRVFTVPEDDGKPSNFLLASFFHPGVLAALIHHGVMTNDLLDSCMKGIVSQSQVLDDDSELFVQGALKVYLHGVRIHSNRDPGVVDCKAIAAEGVYNGFSLLQFWRSVLGLDEPLEIAIQLFGTKLHHLRNLVRVCSMLAAVPASEAVDEGVFSSTGNALTKLRNCLSPTTLEQVTVVRMYIRKFGGSPNDIQMWMAEARQASSKRP